MKAYRHPKLPKVVCIGVPGDYVRVLTADEAQALADDLYVAAAGARASEALDRQPHCFQVADLMREVSR